MVRVRDHTQVIGLVKVIGYVKLADRNSVGADTRHDPVFIGFIKMRNTSSLFPCPKIVGLWPVGFVLSSIVLR